jgi:basic membrane protein A and related proteins
MKNKLFVILSCFICTLMLLSACGQAATPTAAPVPPTAAPVAAATTAPTQPPAVAATVAPTTASAAAPCLIIGATYGGSTNDSGYNQAMHEAVTAIKTKIPCVKIIEAENVYDEAGATSTMQNMINQGAKLIFATASTHQDPAFALAKTNPNVIFEAGGGWETSANFGNYFGIPQDGWYLMGIAAGKMTKSNKLGFVAAMPLSWTNVFINAYQLGAQSVNPDAKVYVTYTQSWGDSAKEADAVNALINQGADVITTNVDSPTTVVSTAESRGIYSVGYQDLAAQQFAPQYWISGTGLTLGGQLTFLAQEVIDGKWGDVQFARCGLKDGCIAVAPFGPKVPQAVQDLVNQKKADIVAGTYVVFTGPIVDQAGTVRVPAGQAITSDQLNNDDWFVKGVVGSSK